MIYLKDEDKTPEMKYREIQLETNISDLLYKMYVEEKQEISEISIYLGVSRRTITDWLERCHIYHRKLGE